MTTLPLPRLASVLLQSRRDALAAFLALGWRPWADPAGLDAERRRTLNMDLSEPEVSFGAGAAVRAVAHVELDRDGLVALVEVVAGEPVRLWICAEQAYGDRLWLVASVVRRAGDDD